MKQENKKTFTYATKPSIRAKAMKKAAKEKLSLSEKIDEMLCEYVRPKKKTLKGGIPLPDDYIYMKNVGLIDKDEVITPLSSLWPSGK